MFTHTVRSLSSDWLTCLGHAIEVFAAQIAASLCLAAGLPRRKCLGFCLVSAAAVGVDYLWVSP